MQWLDWLLTRQLIRHIDYEFAHFIYDISIKYQANYAELNSATALLVSFITGQKHTCLPIAYLNWAHHFPELTSDLLQQQNFPLLSQNPVKLQQLIIIGDPSTTKPLIYDYQSLYLQRYWQYEVQVARFFQQQPPALPINLSEAKKGLQQLFPANNSVIDWQKIACSLACIQSYLLLIGGPGTGKTTTVTKLLALWLMTATEPLVIKLVAPTGKAALRLSESIQGSKQRLNVPHEVITQIPTQATTIHQLLGSQRFSPKFHHDKQQPLFADIVLVDEVSMVDLALMSKLLQALPQHCRLVLLGDSDQLSSVEAGSVLADLTLPFSLTQQLYWSSSVLATINTLCDQNISTEVNLKDNIRADYLVALRKSYRFIEGSGIGQLAATIKQKNSTQLSTIIQGTWSDLTFITQYNQQPFIDQGVVIYQRCLTAYQHQQSPTEILQLFHHERILCALRRGPYGVKGINEGIEKQLIQQQLITTQELFYIAKPIILLENNSHLGLFNGDIGLLLPDVNDNHHIKAFFLEGEDQVRAFHPGRLPKYELSFALTIHKSQGSEFNHGIIVLPPTMQHHTQQLLSNELLYTAVTRCRKHCTLYATQEILPKILQKTSTRYSHLAQRLYPDHPVATLV